MGEHVHQIVAQLVDALLSLPASCSLAAASEIGVANHIAHGLSLRQIDAAIQKQCVA